MDKVGYSQSGLFSVTPRARSVFPGLLPACVTAAASQASGWLLLVAIGSVGLKTLHKDILNVGAPAALFVLIETVFLAGFIVLGLGLSGQHPSL